MDPKSLRSREEGHHNNGVTMRCKRQNISRTCGGTTGVCRSSESECLWSATRSVMYYPMLRVRQCGSSENHHRRVCRRPAAPFTPPTRGSVCSTAKSSVRELLNVARTDQTRSNHYGHQREEGGKVGNAWSLARSVPVAAVKYRAMT